MMPNTPNRELRISSQKFCPRTSTRAMTSTPRPASRTLRPRYWVSARRWARREGCLRAKEDEDLPFPPLLRELLLLLDEPDEREDEDERYVDLPDLELAILPNSSMYCVVFTLADRVPSPACRLYFSRGTAVNYVMGQTAPYSI